MNATMGRDQVAAGVVRNRETESNIISLSGLYTIEVFRKGELVHLSQHKNIITLEGRRHIIDVAMHGGNGTTYYNKTAFYVLLGATDQEPQSGWNYDNINTNFTEFTNYSDSGGRRPWTGVLDGSAATITNVASKAVFNIGTPGQATIYGAGLASYQTKDNNDAFGINHDVLVSYSKFGSSIGVGLNDVVNVTVALTLN
jgi:hypothetical protein